ncbi:glutathione peroxidase [Halioglobus japonicus]|uniref:Glutathione peroxidase n=1 Tax=Halioglobus japonicus TaxID=930805 RepID=A0AAP8MBK8_9GAMM|nr:glutathione peroxidase [Halioglobus japonicus]AQA20390.1 glutathione peroxidase [Halioglobus japonicus]PLW84624.1 glutathione peroxidase [Halioglobus japonicus]GHD22718.1 glutathione peroxidase [Halioglobus japonicus]
MTTVFDFTVQNAAGTDRPLDEFKGQVLLIVNTASKCGFTPQFAGLEELYEKYKDKGVSVIGFPCNQFGKQDPGSNDEIQEFCQLNYGVSFPMMGKIEVNGSGADPLFKHLKDEAPGLLTKNIKWNFTKFLVDAEGNVVKRYAPTTKPADIEKDIDSLLA